MFSFRTTPLEQQLDRALLDGKVACVCAQSSWDPRTRSFVYDMFARRGNLQRVLMPSDEPLGSRFNFLEGDFRDISALVVDIQDTGVRSFGYAADLMRAMDMLSGMDNPPSLYIVDHPNPAGRVVEGTMPQAAPSGCPKVSHRHGLTLGELACLYHGETDAPYALHVISALAADSMMMPWTIPPTPAVPGLFTCDVLSGGVLWEHTNFIAGEGTARPYEMVGAPMFHTIGLNLPESEGAILRPASFIPMAGRYRGDICHGFQIILLPGEEYHSLIHTLRIMRCLTDSCREFIVYQSLREALADDLLYSYVTGEASEETMREHVKTEEQKWIRKARKCLLYEDKLYRFK